MSGFGINRYFVAFAITCLLVTYSNAQGGPGNSNCPISVVADCSVIGTVQCASINRPELPTNCTGQPCIPETVTLPDGRELTILLCTAQLPDPGELAVTLSEYRVKPSATINSLDPTPPGQAGSTMFKYCKPLMACFQKKSCERFCGGLFVADPNNCSSTLFDDWADVNEYWTISVEPGSNCVGGEGPF